MIHTYTTLDNWTISHGPTIVIIRDQFGDVQHAEHFACYAYAVDSFNWWVDAIDGDEFILTNFALDNPAPMTYNFNI